MRRFIFIALSLMIFHPFTRVNAAQKMPEKTTLIDQDSTFQKEINTVVAESFLAQDDSSITEKILELENEKVIPEEWKNYWMAYLFYHKAILYKNELEDEKKASESVSRAIELLKGNLDSSENKVLYAACLSYSIQFAKGLQVPKISQEVNQIAAEAVKQDSGNLRGYYVLASHDFHTPKMFGGGQKTETYATKGLALSPTAAENEFYAPAWGKRRLYKILMSYYKERDETKKLKDIYAQAVKDFPDEF